MKKRESKLTFVHAIVNPPFWHFIILWSDLKLIIKVGWCLIFNCIDMYSPRNLLDLLHKLHCRIHSLFKSFTYLWFSWSISLPPLFSHLIWHSHLSPGLSAAINRQKFYFLLNLWAHTKYYDFTPCHLYD